MGRIILVAVAFLMLTAVAMAETTVEVDGQVRIRSELDDRSLLDTSGTRMYELMRTRIGITANVNENVSAYVQLQDSRMFGETNHFGGASSGTLNDNQNVDLHQGYIKVNRILTDGLGFQAGRFEVNLGNQRVFGGVGWSNVGRSWDGSMGWYATDNFKLTGFGLKALEVNDSLFNRDTDVGGLHAAINSMNLELLVAVEVNNDTIGYPGGFPNANKDYNQKVMTRLTLGAYYTRKHDQFDFTLNAGLQTGEHNNNIDGDTIAYTVDISALMFAFEAGMSFEGDHPARIGVGFDFTSGDDPTTADYEGYDNLYYTGHKFRGYMDYFVGSNEEGLMDLMVRGKYSPKKDWLIKADLHLFSTAEDYMWTVAGSPVLQTSKSLGTEFDFTVGTTSLAGIDLTGGISVFLPSGDLVESLGGNYSDDATWWLFEQATVNF